MLSQHFFHVPFFKMTIARLYYLLVVRMYVYDEVNGEDES